jgi:glucokinase
VAIGIGLDVGATKVLGCAVEEDGAIVAEVRLDSPRTQEQLVAVLTASVAALLERLGDRVQELGGVGVGLPGLVDGDGVLHDAANIHGAEGLDLPRSLRPRLEALLAMSAMSSTWRLVVDNDATCAAAGEHRFGAGRGVDSSVMVTLGTGIGGGIVEAGAILHGEQNFAGEIGHMVVDPSGPLCGCGRRGCWERFASGTGLAYLGGKAAAEGRAPRLLGLAGGDANAVRAEHVVAAAREQDAGATAVVAAFGDYLALGLANLAEILDPGRIILGGGLVAAGEVLFGPGLRAYASRSRRGSGPRAVPVVMAELKERSGAAGAAALALGGIA